MCSITHLLLCNWVRQVHRIMRSLGVTGKWVTSAGIWQRHVSLPVETNRIHKTIVFDISSFLKNCAYIRSVISWVSWAFFIISVANAVTYFSFWLYARYLLAKKSSKQNDIYLWSGPKAWACTCKMCPQRSSAHLTAVVDTILRVRTHVCFDCWWSRRWQF